MSTYHTGKIYAIKCNETDDVYIGSTVLSLNGRLSRHKCAMENYTKGKHRHMSSFDIIKYDSAYIELLEAYPCNSKEELERKEGEYIRGMECVNKNIAGRTSREKYEEKKEEILQKAKEYYQVNKEEILQQSKEKYTCVCGSSVSRWRRRRHERSNKHQNYIKEIDTNGDPQQLNDFFEQFKFKVSL